MTKLSVTLLAIPMLALAACSWGSDDTSGTNEADEFAARINGGQAPAQAGAGAQTAANAGTPVPGAVATPSYVPGTSADPNAVICGAPTVAAFFGREANDATRAELAAALGSQTQVRFVPPGSAFINPDPTSTQLNIMIDSAGVIRDARCG